MRRISHREFRNNSAVILREVQAGEIMEITNHGEVVAVLSPPSSDVYNGFKVRRARKPLPDRLPLSTLPSGAAPFSATINQMREEDRQRLDPR